jgi:hypothetical protein
MATPSDVAEELALEFGEQFSDTDIADQFIRWVKEKYQEIALTSRLFFKNAEHPLTLEPEGSTYSLPASVAEPRVIYLYGSGATEGAATDPTDIGFTSVARRVNYMPIERLTARGANLNEAGQPKVFYIVGFDGDVALEIRVWPVPAIYYGATVYASDRPATLDDDDTIPLPEEYIVALKNGVRAMVYTNDNNPQQAEMAESKYVQLLMTLNSRFSGPPPSASRLQIKKLRGAHQLGAAVDGA